MAVKLLERVLYLLKINTWMAIQVLGKKPIGHVDDIQADYEKEEERRRKGWDVLHNIKGEF